MKKNYNILAKHIVQKYIDCLSGNDIEERIIGNELEQRVMVGMLAENRVETSLSGKSIKYLENASTKYDSIPSITLSFIAEKNVSGNLKVIPSGLLFYSVESEYQEIVDYVIKSYSTKDKIKYTSILEIQEKHPSERFPLPLTYKTCRLENVFEDGIEIPLNTLSQGTFHLEHEIEPRLSALADSLMPEISVVQSSHINFGNLQTENDFNAVVSKKGEVVYPRWKLDILVTVVDDDDSWHITLQMVNKTTLGKQNKNIGYLPQIFNAGMRVVGNSSVKFRSISLDCIKNSFKSKNEVFAVAENVSAKFYEDKNEIQTENIPVYYQYRLRTKDEYNQYITFEKLIENPVENLRIIKKAMDEDYAEREKEYRTSFHLTPQAKEKFREALDEYRNEIERFDVGIRQIEYRDFVKKAFLCMNKAFNVHLPGEIRPIPGWRLFQIVFIVSLIPEVIKSEYKDDASLYPVTLDVANLLYFPTGGGKTEAFLGITAFTMFFDRFRGKDEGVTSIIKYPLRLLAVQQLDRVLTIIVKANMVKANELELNGTNDFSVGFYVGKANTPNKIEYNEALSSRGRGDFARGNIIDSDTSTLNEYYRFIDTCPICGQKTINISFNREKWTLEHICSNPECGKTLPLFIVDSEIYRYLPTVIVSTLDKMAMLGLTPDFKMLFGQVKNKCSIHGFTNKDHCATPECRGHLAKNIPPLKDPVPTLFIQDELHLVKESLGTFDSHYESFIKNYALHLVPENQRKEIRFIGATATIANYDVQIRHLYHSTGRRFPCEYPSMTPGRDFYSYTDETDITRIILGYVPYGRSVVDGIWQSAYYMRLIVYRMFNDRETYQSLCALGLSATFDEYQEMIHNYWIELIYNNRKQDATELENTLQNQGNNFLEEEGVPTFNIKQMTSDTDFQSVRRTLFDIQANKGKFESTNLLLATSTISHGVDENSFNIMYFFGIPNNNAEYIQAYSRTGRQFTGIVIDIIRLMRVRDRSYLKNFVLFHENKDDLVEAVPINRWAKNAIYNTLPGILAGLILQYYARELNANDLYSARNLKKRLNNGDISIEDVVEKIILIYGCNKQEKLSLAYEEIIRTEITNILSGIKTSNFTKETLPQAISKFSHGRKEPMTSLRDTEEKVVIKIGV